VDNRGEFLGVGIEPATVVGHKAELQWVLEEGAEDMRLRSLGAALVRRLATEGVLQHSETSLRCKAGNRFCSQNILHPFSSS
jgi:hypothetical protein